MFFRLQQLNSSFSYLLLLKVPFLTVAFLMVSFFSMAGSGDKEHLVGETQAKTVLSQYSAFQAEYQDYQPSEKELAQMAVLSGKELLVMFGTWCHDSQREVPRLMKLLDKSQVELANITWLAVDTQKQDPQGIAKQNRLKYTPTFVLFDNGTETGRVIERPNGTLASALAKLSVN